MKNLFEKVHNLALKEIEKYGNPVLEYYILSVQKGEEITKRLNANVELVKTAVALIDIKLGECHKLGIPKQHVQKSYEYAKQILKENKVDKTTTKFLLDCVLNHHTIGKRNSLEEEIVINADCYRFIHPLGVFAWIQEVTRRGKRHNEAIDLVLAKLEEKHNLLSLDCCKKELEPYYKKIKKLLEEAKVKE